MPIELWACLAPDCTTVFFRTVDGKCPRCGEQGQSVFWTLKPPRTREDE